MFLGTILLVASYVVVWPAQGQELRALMRPDKATILRWQEAYEKAPRAYIDETIDFRATETGSLDLFVNLDYDADQRDQGACGNCWAWAGTGVMEIALDFQEGIRKRLSVQYLNSCFQEYDYPNLASLIVTSACCGGTLDDLASFYNASGRAMAWSNVGANWVDYDKGCLDSPTVSCSKISGAIHYPIRSMQAQVVTTRGHSITQERAITNIKNVLNQGKGIYFSIYFSDASVLNEFDEFWLFEDEESVWNPDSLCDREYDEDEVAGHAVLCLGYNDDDPSNRYWIMLNSWGTVGGRRPSGVFRMDMDMDYDCMILSEGRALINTFQWKTLGIDFNVSKTSGDVFIGDFSGGSEDGSLGKGGDDFCFITTAAYQ